MLQVCSVGFRTNDISKYIQTAVKGGKTQPYSGVEPQKTPKFFFKIPYVEHFSVTAQRSIRKLANQLCKPIDLRLVFTTFKVTGIFLMWKMLSLRGYARVWSINFRVQVVMLAMLVKPADTSPHECASTYFQTGLRTFLQMFKNIYRVQSFVEHPTHRIASRSWTLQPLSTKWSLRNPCL